MFKNDQDVKDYMDNFAYYPKSESNKTKVYIDVFLLVRKAKRQKAKPSAIPKKKKKENLVLPPHLVFEILAPEESYPDKGACPEIKTSKMQVLHHTSWLHGLKPRSRNPTRPTRGPPVPGVFFFNAEEYHVNYHQM